MDLEKRILHRMGKNKLVRDTLLTLSALTAFGFINGAYSQTLENKAETEQVSNNEQSIMIFLDGMDREDNYIRQNLSWVSYSRDREFADVHIMMTTQRTGSGGREHTLTFTGQNNFEGMSDVLTYVSQQTDTRDMVRRGITDAIERGLVRYVSQTPFGDNIKVDYRGKTTPVFEEDGWANWVITFRSNISLDQEESKKTSSVGGSFSGDKVTKDWKVSLSASTSYRGSHYVTDEEDIRTISRSYSFRSLIAKSLNDHWSFGGYGDALHSSFSNTDLSVSLAPAIEYNVFPYEESTRREFRFLYRIGARNRKYLEETIYGKLKENLFYQSLSATLEIKEPWGSVETTLEGSNYFHDWSKNMVRSHVNLNLRLFEGFSLNLHGNFSWIHNQLSLPQEGATDEEILLSVKQVATDYDARIEMGFQVQFGSRTRNIVNPRFGETRRRYY
ncbi:hypothetical protein ACFL5K_02670 [Gemmatimonadota bacterium]